MCNCLFFPFVTLTWSETNYYEQLKTILESLDDVKKESIIKEYFDKIDANEMMRMLEQCCINKDKEFTYLLIRVMKNKWGSSPPLDTIVDNILDKNRDKTFRFIMVDALGAYKRDIKDKDASEIINKLIVLIEDEKNDYEIRAVVITRLTSIIYFFTEKGVIDSAIKDEYGARLLSYLGNEDESIFIRNVSASGLAEIQDMRVLPVLFKMLEERERYSPEMQRSIVGALGVLKDKEAILPLSEVLKTTPYDQVYGTTAYSLGLIGTSDIIEPLVENITRFDMGSCKNALKRNEELLLDVIRGNVNGPVIASIKALGEINCTKAAEPLSLLLRNENSEIRKEIVRALGKIKPLNIKDTLLELKKVEKNEEVIQELEGMLAE